jgi:hypothetical protein
MRTKHITDGKNSQLVPNNVTFRLGEYETLPTCNATRKNHTAVQDGTVWFCDGTTWGANGTAAAGFSILTGSTTWDAANFNDDAVVATTVTVTGAALGDPCFAGYSSIGAQAILCEAHVQSANTVRVQLYNASAGAQDPGSGTVNVVCFDLS